MVQDVKRLEKIQTKQQPNYNSEVSVSMFTRTKIKSDFKSANSENIINQKNLDKTDQLVIESARDQTNIYQCVNGNGNGKKWNILEEKMEQVEARWSERIGLLIIYLFKLKYFCSLLYRNFFDKIFFKN